MSAMTTLRMMSNDFARLAVRHVGGVEPTNGRGRGRQDKSAAFGRAHVVGWTIVSSLFPSRPAGASAQKCRLFNDNSAIAHLGTARRRP
jgi:hypothetical protein